MRVGWGGGGVGRPAGKKGYIFPLAPGGGTGHSPIWGAQRTRPARRSATPVEGASLWKWGLPHHQTAGGWVSDQPQKIGLSLVKWFFAHLLVLAVENLGFRLQCSTDFFLVFFLAEELLMVDRYENFDWCILFETSKQHKYTVVTEAQKHTVISDCDAKSRSLGPTLSIVR